MRRLALTLVATLAFGASAGAVPNADDDLGFFSGFWTDWPLTVRLEGCGPAMGRHVCNYRSMNQDGLEIGFGSEGDGTEVTNFLVMRKGGEDVDFLATFATAMKALAPELSKEEREALSKSLYRKALADGEAEQASGNVRFSVTRVTGSTWVAEGVTD